MSKLSEDPKVKAIVEKAVKKALAAAAGRAVDACREQDCPGRVQAAVKSAVKNVPEADEA